MLVLCVFSSPSKLLVTSAFVLYGFEPLSHEGVPDDLDALFLIFFVVLATPRTSFFPLLAAPRTSFFPLLVSFFTLLVSSFLPPSL